MIIMILNLYNKQNGSNRLPFHTYHSNSAGETIIKIENADNKSHLYNWVPSQSTKIHTMLQKKYKTYQIARSIGLLSLLYLEYLVYTIMFVLPMFLVTL